MNKGKDFMSPRDIEEGKEPQFVIDQRDREHVWLNDRIMSIMIRLKKTYDATQSIAQILLKINKIENMKSQLKKEFKTASKIRNKGYYFVILKLSCRIFNLIERLRVDFPLLNRPFIYNNGNY